MPSISALTYSSPDKKEEQNECQGYEIRTSFLVFKNQQFIK